MALSYYNWPENNSAAVTAYHPLFRPPSPLPEMFSFHEESTYYDTGSINSIFDQNDIFTPAGNVINPSPEFQVSTFTYQDPYYSNFPYSPEQFLPAVKYAMAPELPLPETGCYGGDSGCVAFPAWCGGGGGDGNYGQVEVKRKTQELGKLVPGGGSLSAQSMAARVRRRRISEKTQELGKLVPGGQKMNTAEMFQAAFKYIKFLQAQIGVLKLMQSLPESEEVMSNGEMEALVTCTMMQEKLYIAEKCIGPNTWQESSK
ncbi:hypothetical protein SSX86_015477 [Deinandra increscens subsp. villosa]|uniref:BHLH domain-containing protein n=1 Tax=Deinandra increscens subsp. villosa TaxID=3103831 RepID=A0AAP0H132_9ASTR